MSLCGKCNVPIAKPNEAAVCVECHSSFHPPCTRLRSVENFKKLPSSRKSGWKCDTCSGEMATSPTAAASDSDLASSVLASIQALRTDMSQQFKTVNENVTSVKTDLAGVKATIDNLQSSINNLTAENAARKLECEALVEENKQLTRQVNELNWEVQDLQQYSRRDNIEIQGVPYSNNENVYAILNEIAKLIKIPFNREEISIAHRIPNGSQRRHPTIIVKFISRWVKNSWMAAAKKCDLLNAAQLHDSWESTSIFMNDHLTAANKQVLGYARKQMRERKLSHAWTRDCRIYVRRNAEGPVKLVRSVKEVDEVIQSS